MAMEVDAEAAAALAEVEPGAEVVVFFGTWCSDSRRELSRLWRAFDEAGLVDDAMLPFDVEYVAVDREKVEPAERTAGMGIRYVPTFIVYRDGAEVGRMVEVSPNGIEHDLLALLTGEASGVVSARDDLGASSDDDQGH
ncbi:MAG TPA: thioredoxin family protein [Thermoanaerobaculia bacterium]|nr:thioredoxin family protein [Thermoanaerobaculia bacterium]